MKEKSEIKKNEYKKFKDINDKNSYYSYLIEVNVENGLKMKKLLNGLKIKAML